MPDGDTPTVARTETTETSRDSEAGAGWRCPPGSYTQLMDAPPVRRGAKVGFSWVDPRPLWQSRNDRIARMFGDPVGEMRREWVKNLPGDPDRVEDVSSADGSISFLVLGDPGEGDGSQYAVVPAMLAHAADTAFLYICSDVIYPAGGINEYRYNFFKPYRAYEGPIYAVPGNHDWYDNCSGFMYWFCGAESVPKPKGFVRRLLWRKPPGGRKAEIDGCKELRPDAARQPRQPGPYFVLDTGPVVLVGIDTGITNVLDEDQGKWLERVSKGDKPKILMTGKPIYVDGKYNAGKIIGGGTVDEIVTRPEHNYIAAIGGDIHNYQRYPVKIDDDRTLMYLVSGGGGAFMHGTHTIPNIDQLKKVGEANFRCYPLRGDSLSRFSQLYEKKWLGRRLGAKFIPPKEASALLGKRLGLTPTRDDAKGAHISEASRASADRLRSALLPERKQGALHIPFSEWLDTNEPPMFKSFLKIDADSDSVRIRCFGVTGCKSHERKPKKEDDLRAERQPDGKWRWSWPAE